VAYNDGLIGKLQSNLYNNIPIETKDVNKLNQFINDGHRKNIPKFKSF